MSRQGAGGPTAVVDSAQDVSELDAGSTITCEKVAEAVADAATTLRIAIILPPPRLGSGVRLLVRRAAPQTLAFKLKMSKHQLAAWRRVSKIVLSAPPGQPRADAHQKSSKADSWVPFGKMLYLAKSATRYA